MSGRDRAAVAGIFRWELGSATRIGARAEQQDRLAILSSRDGARHALVVADGLGGPEAGASAAELAVATVTRLWQACPPRAETAHAFILEACRLVHQVIELDNERTRRRAGTTLVLAVLDAAEVHWGHVGDSRLYLLRRGHIASRTRDHSLVQLMLERGEIREEDMAHHPDQNKLLQCLGATRRPAPLLGRASLGHGDVLLLASDGLWTGLPPAEFAGPVQARDLDEEAGRLAGLAERRLGDEADNIALILARSRRPAPLRTRLDKLLGNLARVWRHHPDNPSKGMGEFAPAITSKGFVLR